MSCDLGLNVAIFVNSCQFIILWLGLLCPRKGWSGSWANHHTSPFFCHWWKACQEKHEGLPGTREKCWVLGLDPAVFRSGWVQSRNPNALNWAGHESYWQQFRGKQLVTSEHTEQDSFLRFVLFHKLKKSARCLVTWVIFSRLHAVLIVVVEYSEQEFHFSCLSSLKDFPQVKIFCL